VDLEATSYIDTLKVQYGEDVETTEEGKKVVTQLKVDILNGLVEMKIMDLKIKESGMDTETDEITKAITERIDSVKSAYDDDAAYEEALTSAGFTAESYLDFVTKDIVRSAYYEVMTKDVVVSDEEISANYEENKATYVTKAGAKIYHIYFGTDDAAKLKAEEALNKIKVAGEDFAEVAKTYGQDASAAEGGLLGYYAYDTTELYADFMTPVKALKEGEISDVVQSTAGYHIIKVTDVQAEDVQQPLEDVKETISATLLQTKKEDKYNTDMETWKKDLNVKIYESRIQ
jgi:foldase protein PrsA